MILVKLGQNIGVAMRGNHHEVAKVYGPQQNTLLK